METSRNITVQFFTDISFEIPSILLNVNGKRILVDPGRNEAAIKSDEILPRYGIRNLDAIVITHYHGDHVNLLDEILASNQFNGPIICHAATCDIIKAYHPIKKRFHKQFIRLAYGERFNLFGNDWLMLLDAGHVLGSSIIYFRFQDKNITITGDLGADFLPIVREPTTEFPTGPIDLLIVDAKQASKQREVKCPLGYILYRKLEDCFLFDDGNILMYAPLVQIPMLIYCLNFIFNNNDYRDIHNKIFKVFLDPQKKLLDLLKIFGSYKALFDYHDIEYVSYDSHPFNFKKLVKSLPTKKDIRRSIIITPNRNIFIKYFKQFKQSEKNDVFLLNSNIHYALEGNNDLIDDHCNIQIKRLPFLHYHPDLHELTNWCKIIRNTVGVKRLTFYHYKKYNEAEGVKCAIKKEGFGDVNLVHELGDNSIKI